MAPALPLAPHERVNWRSSIPFLVFHLVPFAAVFTGIDRRAVVIAVVLYATRMFFVTGGYHRYFSHRSYRVGRPMQLLLAIGGTTALQKGPLWWASHHRSHHRFSDTADDVHSPLKGFWYSHVGWILSDKHSTPDLDAVRDLARYPELRLVERFDWVAPWALGIGTFLIGGWSGLVIGFFASTVVLWHATFTVNSLAHVFGRRRYATKDTSRNSLLIALYAGGEGWHNNHHHHQASARQGFFWWEVDTTWYVLRALAAVGLVRDLRRPPQAALVSARTADGCVDVGMFRSHWLKARRALDFDADAQPGPDSVGADHAFDAQLHQGRVALAHGVEACLRSAESLGRLARQRQQSSAPAVD